MPPNHLSSVTFLLLGLTITEQESSSLLTAAFSKQFVAQLTCLYLNVTNYSCHQIWRNSVGKYSPNPDP